MLSFRPQEPNRTCRSLRRALSTLLTTLSDTVQHAAGSNIRCGGMAIPPRKTHTNPPMGFCSRSSTGTGVRASKDGLHVRNHALERASSHRSADRAREGGWQRREVSGTDFVYCGRSPCWAIREQKFPEGVESPEVARALRRWSRRGVLGRGAGGPDRGRGHQWCGELLAHHGKDILYGVELRVVLDTLALRRSGSK